MEEKMSIIIKKENNINLLYSVCHIPINLTPFTNPGAIQDFKYYKKLGLIKKLLEEIG
jgi:hypothetical protein